MTLKDDNMNTKNLDLKKRHIGTVFNLLASITYNSESKNSTLFITNIGQCFD